MSVYLKLNDLENRLAAAENTIDAGVSNDGNLTITGKLTVGNSNDGYIAGPNGYARINLDETNDRIVIASQYGGQPAVFYTNNPAASELNLMLDNQQDQWLLVAGKSGGAGGTGGFAIYNATSGYVGTGLLIERNHDVTIHGNLKLDSGKGIDFSNDTNLVGMTSELLDDYEEGDWTPALSSATPNFVYNTGTTKGRYIKIGNQVNIYGRIELTSTGSTSTGYVTIVNLPFTAESTFPKGGVTFSFSSNAFGNGHVGYISTNTITIYSISAYPSSVSQPTVAGGLTNSANIVFHGIYIAS